MPKLKGDANGHNATGTPYLWKMIPTRLKDFFNKKKKKRFKNFFVLGPHLVFISSNPIAVL